MKLIHIKFDEYLNTIKQNTWDENEGKLGWSQQWMYIINIKRNRKLQKLCSLKNLKYILL